MGKGKKKVKTCAHVRVWLGAHEKTSQPLVPYRERRSTYRGAEGRLELVGRRSRRMRAWGEERGGSLWGRNNVTMMALQRPQAAVIDGGR